MMDRMGRSGVSSLCVLGKPYIRECCELLGLILS